MSLDYYKDHSLVPRPSHVVYWAASEKSFLGLVDYVVYMHAWCADTILNVVYNL